MNRNGLNFIAFGIGFLLSGILCGPALADNDESAGREFRETLLRPEKVVSISGNVQNAEALVKDHEGYATLSWRGQETAPQIVLDYGRDVGGFPIVEVSSVSGAPKVQTIYSESQQYLLPAGDGAPSFPNAPGDPSRVDIHRVSSPGLIVNRLVQGGERFQALTLTTPGTVTLRSVGIRSTTFHPPRSFNRGSFHSSDSQLNEIWNLGAYTLLLDQLPPDSQPPLWTVTLQGVDVPYSPTGLYQGGGGWTDYTAAFDVQVVANEAAWVVRDNALIGFAIILDADNDALNTPDALRVVQVGLFGSAPVTSVPLPFHLKPATWHAVKTAAAGSQVSVYVDDLLIIQFNVPITGFPSAAMGSFGFQNGQGAEAIFRNLSVVSSTGQNLYTSTLMDRSALDVFAAGTNRLPVIIDGSKRDRLTFAGDLVLAAPTVYYTNGATEYVAGSLSLFAGFQSSTGEVSSDLSPLLTPGIVVSDALAAPNGGYYSLSYSIHFVNALYDYYLLTARGLKARQGLQKKKKGGQVSPMCTT